MATRREKKAEEQMYVALNQYEGCYIVGTKSEVKTVVKDWFEYQDDLEEGSILVYKLGNRCPIETTREVSVHFEWA